MMDEYIDVKVDVFEHAGQRARVRKSLTVSDLIREILREFDDIAASSPEKYAIYLKGVDRPYSAGATIAQLDIQPQDHLVFDYVRQALRQMLEPHQVVYLREESTGKVYDIEWQPAVIGRPTNEMDHNIVLAVNMQSHPDGITISRRHAQITFSEGRYYLEAIAAGNPVTLNGKEIPVNMKREIKNGDRLVLGRNEIAMIFMRQKPAVKEVHPVEVSRPVSQPVPQSGSLSSAAPEHVEGGDATHLAPGAEISVMRLLIEKSSISANVGQRLELAAYPFVLGRENPLLGSEAEVSRRHAEISFDAASLKYFITDLKSTNGVTLNGVRLEVRKPVEIHKGSRIGLGTQLVLCVEM